MCSRSSTALQMKRNLYNFALLFVSNVENLLAYMVQGYIGDSYLHFIEVILGTVYLAAVLYNTFWFLTPLSDREEYDALKKGIEERLGIAINFTMKPFRRLKTKAADLLKKVGIVEVETESKASSPRRPSMVWRLGARAAIFTREKKEEEKTKDDGPRTKVARDDPFEEQRKEK